MFKKQLFVATLFLAISTNAEVSNQDNLLATQELDYSIVDSNKSNYLYNIETTIFEILDLYKKNENEVLNLENKILLNKENVKNALLATNQNKKNIEKLNNENNNKKLILNISYEDKKKLDKFLNQ